MGILAVVCGVLGIIGVVLGLVVSQLLRENRQLAGQVALRENGIQVLSVREASATKGLADAQRLIGELSKLVAKPPLIVQPPPPAPLPDVAAIVKEVGESIAKNLVGWGQEPRPSPTIEQLMAGMDMGSLGLDHTAGTGGKTWVPDTELDPFMDGAAFPTHGGWVQQETPVSSMFKDTVVSENGVERKDGSPMFKAGEGGATPDGGVE